MNNRINMNTSSIQENNKDVYKKFFAENDLVMSGCFSFAWNNVGIGHKSQFVHLKNKLPLKCYLGIQVLSSQNIVNFKEVNYYNLSKKMFEKFKFSQINKKEEEICLFIKNFLKYNKYEGGLNISVLSESSRGHGLGFSGSCFASLSIAIFMLIGKLNIDLVKDYDVFLKSDIFKDIFKFAWKLDFISRYGNSNGDNSMAAFINYEYPIVYFTEKFEDIIEVDCIDNLSYNYKPLTEVFGKTNLISELPIDFFLVFSGLPTDTEKIEKFKKFDENKFDDLKALIGENILGISEKAQNEDFINLVTNDNIYKNLTNTLSILNFETINIIKQILDKGYAPILINKLIDHINNLRHVSKVIERQTDFGEDFIYLFNKNKTSKDDKIGILPLYSGKIGGNYLVLVNHGNSKQIFLKTMNDLKQYYPNIDLEYDPNIDGYCSDGIKIEQYLSGGIYSNYIQKDKLILKGNAGTNTIGDYNELLDMSKKGLLLDTINKKIYFDGIKLTSNEIHSQVTTIEVLEKLLENPGNEISNIDFSISSYSKNKNEMIGKIVLPLIRFLKSKTGKDLQLICKGSLNEFYLKMIESNIEISVIKKIL